MTTAIAPTWRRPRGRRWRLMAIVEETRPLELTTGDEPTGSATGPVGRVRPPQGQHRLAVVGQHGRSQEDRHHVRRRVVLLPARRRGRGAAHPHAARGARQRPALGGPVQPGLHDARRHHGVHGRHADGLCVRQLPAPAADRRTRRVVPPHERPVAVDLAGRCDLLQHARGSWAAARTAAGSTTPPTPAWCSRRATASTSTPSAC